MTSLKVGVKNFPHDGFYEHVMVPGPPCATSHVISKDVKHQAKVKIKYKHKVAWFADRSSQLAVYDSNVVQIGILHTRLRISICSSSCCIDRIFIIPPTLYSLKTNTFHTNLLRCTQCITIGFGVYV